MHKTLLKDNLWASANRRSLDTDPHPIRPLQHSDLHVAGKQTAKVVELNSEMVKKRVTEAGQIKGRKVARKGTPV